MRQDSSIINVVKSRMVTSPEGLKVEIASDASTPWPYRRPHALAQDSPDPMVRLQGHPAARRRCRIRTCCTRHAHPFTRRGLRVLDRTLSLRCVWSLFDQSSSPRGQVPVLLGSTDQKMAAT